jgi:hypothetical protein
MTSTYYFFVRKIVDDIVRNSQNQPVRMREVQLIPEAANRDANDANAPDGTIVLTFYGSDNGNQFVHGQFVPVTFGDAVPTVPVELDFKQEQSENN